jgi:hypothetical protein
MNGSGPSTVRAITVRAIRRSGRRRAVGVRPARNCAVIAL